VVNHSVTGSVAAMTVYHNPVTNGYEIVSFSQQVKVAATVRLIDLAGRQLYSKDIASQAGELSVDLTSLALRPGIYLLSVTANGRTTTQRIVVQ